jgi:DNA-binding response OmpR family regulator
MSANVKLGKILVVEDDSNVAALLRTYLQKEGFDVTVRRDGRQGFDEVTKLQPALIVLDIRLPTMDGWEFCRQIRRISNIPIIILTAQIEEADKIAGLRMGADDYVVKPFSPREVVERVKAVLRRAPSHASVYDAKPLICGRLAISTERAEVTKNDEPVALTLSEFRILHALMSAPGRVFTRNDLLDQLHDGSAEVVDRIVDVHVGNLRRKIEDDPSMPEYVLTVRGIGYKFRDDLKKTGGENGRPS